MWRNSVPYFLYLVDCGSIIEAMKDELRRNRENYNEQTERVEEVYRYNSAESD